MAQARKGDGQTALVTGARAGIGVDLAECFAQDGYDLILAARTRAPCATSPTGSRRRTRIKATPIAADLAPIGGGQRLADAIAEQRPVRRRAREQRRLRPCRRLQRIGRRNPARHDRPERSRAGRADALYWPRMLANRRGGVLNVASTAAFQPGPLMAIYYASKAFVLSFSEALWEEARGTGVKVSCLCPGPTVSKFRERAGTDKRASAAPARRCRRCPSRAWATTPGRPTSASRSPARAIASWRRSCGSCRARWCCAAYGIFNRLCSPRRRTKTGGRSGFSLESQTSSTETLSASR